MFLFVWYVFPQKNPSRNHSKISFSLKSFLSLFEILIFLNRIEIAHFTSSRDSKMKWKKYAFIANVILYILFFALIFTYPFLSANGPKEPCGEASKGLVPLDIALIVYIVRNSIFFLFFFFFSFFSVRTRLFPFLFLVCGGHPPLFIFSSPSSSSSHFFFKVFFTVACISQLLLTVFYATTISRKILAFIESKRAVCWVSFFFSAKKKHGDTYLVASDDLHRNCFRIWAFHAICVPRIKTLHVDLGRYGNSNLFDFCGHRSDRRIFIYFWI